MMRFDVEFFGGMIVGIVIGAAIAFALPALAHDNHALTPAMNEWAQQAPITEEGMKWLGKNHNAYWTKCCNHAEIVDARFIVEPDGSDGWRWIDNGVTRVIPPEIIHPHGDHAPNGKPTLFIYQGVPTCFFLPLGGI